MRQRVNNGIVGPQTNVGGISTVSSLSILTIKSYTVTDSSYNNLDDTAVGTTGGYIKINGTGFASTSTVYINGTLATSTYVNPTEIRAVVPTLSAGTYAILIYNGTIGAVYTSLVTSGFPSWTSTSYTSTSLTVSVQLLATGDGTLTYSLYSGTLPSGLSLSSTGLISGTVSVDSTTTDLVFLVNDGQLQTTQQTISLTITTADPYWKNTTGLLQGDTAPFISDASTNAFTVTPSGDTRPYNFNPYTPGYYSNYFDGTNYLTLTSSASGALDLTQVSIFTVEAWIFTTGYSSQQNSIVSTRDVNSAGGFDLRINSSNLLNFYYTGGSNIASSSSISLNTWYHVAAVRNGATLKLYINGVEVGSGAFTNGTAISQALNIGRSQDDNTQTHKGYISNLRIVSGTAVYTTAFTPSTTPLTAVSGTVLLTCQSNRFIDNSSGSRTITVGGVAVKPNHPFTPNSSYAAYGSGYFDGTGDYLSVAAATPLNLTSGDFTIECWFYLNASGGAQILNKDGVFGSSYAQYEIATNGSTQLMATLGNGNGVSPSTTDYGATTAITLKAWHHVVLQRTGSTISVYFDGTRVTNTAQVTAMSEGNKPLNVGFQTGASAVLNGYISNVRIVKGSAVYTGAAFTPPTTPLTAISGTSLLTLQTNLPHNNNTILDNSTNDFAVTRSGSPVQGTFSPYSENYSNYFDGTGDYLSIANSSVFNLTSDFTFECWIYNSSVVSGETHIFGKRASSAVYSQIIFGLNVSGGVNKMFVEGTTSSGSWNIAYTLGSITLPVGQWNHIAVVRSGTTIKSYVNGVADLTYTGISGSFFTNGDAMTIGTSTTNGSSGYYTGYISNFRFVNGSAVYTGAFTPPTTLLATSQSSGTNIAALTTIGSVNNKSVYFDGTGDSLSAPNNAAFNFLTGDFTIEAWINRTGGSGNQPICQSDAVGTSQNDKWWFAVAGGGLFFGTHNSGGFNVVTTTTFNIGQWYHVAVTRASGVMKLFVDGVSTSFTTTGTPSGYSLSHNGLTIGAMSTPSYWTGYISNLRIVKGTAVYTATFTPPTTPLTAISGTSILTCQSPTIIDNSTNAFTITTNGDAAVNYTTSPFSIDAVKLLACQSNRLIDNSTNAFAITKNGDVTVKPFGPFGRSSEYSIASNGGSVYFNGSSSLSIADNAALQFGTGNFTIELWFYPTSTISTQILLAKGSGADGFEFRSRSNAGGNYFSFWVANAGTAIVQSSAVFTLNTWQHLVVVRSSGTMTLYKDGVNVGSAADSTSFVASGSALKVAVDFSTGAAYSTGYISNVRLVKGTAVYTGAFTPPTAPVVAIQNTGLLIDGTSGAVIDGAQAQNILTNGDARLLNTRYKYGSGSYYFDGTGDTLTFTTEALGAGDFTIEFWMYDTQASDHHIFTLGGSWASAGGVTLVVYAGIYCYSTGSSNNNYYSNAAILNAWTHVAAVRSSGVSKIYFNGTALSPSLTNSTNISDTAFTFAGAPTENWAKFIGYMDDLRITKGYARYAGNFTPPTLIFKAR